MLAGILPFTLPLILLVLVINVLINRTGETVLFMIPWPGSGFPIYLEPLLYSVAMGMKLILLTALFSLLQRCFEPERLIALAGGRFHKTALVLALILRMFPVIMRDVSRITGVLRTRGVVIAGENRVEKIKSLIPIGRIILISSLEQAWQWGEAMRARGYGTGSRTRYFAEILAREDLIVLLSGLMALGVALFTYLMGMGAGHAHQNLPDLVKVRGWLFPVLLTGLILLPHWLLGGRGFEPV